MRKVEICLLWLKPMMEYFITGSFSSVEACRSENLWPRGVMILLTNGQR